MTPRTLTNLLGLVLSSLPGWGATAVDADSREPAPVATVLVDPTVAPRPYNRMVFGGFLEHFDNQIYGGVFDPGSPLADPEGFRRDVVDALRELQVPIIRWPGGCFVDSYHWQKGIGPAREPSGEFRWGVIESNAFGTDEFIQLCRRIGAEPYLCLNGLAEVQENLDWVAYCNATDGPMAERRRANGHDRPFGVRYWSVGNERYDRAYVERVRDTAKAMKALYPGIVITCAGSQGGKGINGYLLEQAGAYLDCLSLHDYWLPRATKLPVYDYLTAISKSELPEAYLSAAGTQLRAAGLGRIKLAFDEWNLRAWQHPGFPRQKVADYAAPEVLSLVALRRQQNDEPSQYTLADALFSASFLNACLRQADDVMMANIAPLVNTRGPLWVHPGGIVRRPHFHTLAMYSRLLRERIVRTKVAATPLAAGAASVAVVDAIATVDPTGRRWSVALVNRHPSRSVACTLALGSEPLNGDRPGTLLTADSTESYNDPAQPDRVAPRGITLTFHDGITLLPPHSLTILSLSP